SRARPPPLTLLLPYTTLFRSVDGVQVAIVRLRRIGARPQLQVFQGLGVRLEERELLGEIIAGVRGVGEHQGEEALAGLEPVQERDRKSTRLNSSHGSISYAVF